MPRPNLTPHQILVAARTLLSDEARWTTEYLARTADGRPTAPHLDNATCFCAIGAVRQVGFYSHEADEALGYLQQAVPAGITDGITELNDHRGHAAVLAAYDEAIRLCSSSS